MSETTIIFISFLVIVALTIYLVTVLRKNASLNAELSLLRGSIQLREQEERRSIDRFKVISQEVLQNNVKNFLELAEQNFQKHEIKAKNELEKKETAISEMIKPIKEHLDKVGVKISEFERIRSEQYGNLSEQMKHLLHSEQQLKFETENLKNALKNPVSRGKWGEIQLKRIVELAGMMNYCDFYEQYGDVSGIRPDLVIRLPNNKTIVVDAKAPYDGYEKSTVATNENERIAALQNHAKQLSDHVKKLGEKSYWSKLEGSPEFVVMFLPGEFLFSAALEVNPSFIEQAVNKQVIVATPSTLIALLKSIAFGWKSEQLSENAQRIVEVGSKLYTSLNTMVDHVSKLGKNLDDAVTSFNSLAGNVESRVLVSGRKLAAFGVGDRELPEPKLINQRPKDFVIRAEDKNNIAIDISTQEEELS